MSGIRVFHAVTYNTGTMPVLSETILARPVFCWIEVGWSGKMYFSWLTVFEDSWKNNSRPSSTDSVSCLVACRSCLWMSLELYWHHLWFLTVFPLQMNHSCVEQLSSPVNEILWAPRFFHSKGLSSFVSFGLFQLHFGQMINIYYAAHILYLYLHKIMWI